MLNLNTTNEISTCKLLKYSPKRDSLFVKLKKELHVAPDVPGFRVLCPTQWNARTNALQSVIDNWEPLQELWDECLSMKLDSEVKAHIIGVKHQIQTIEFFLGLLLEFFSGGILTTCQKLFNTLTCHQLKGSNIYDSENIAIHENWWAVWIVLVYC